MPARKCPFRMDRRRNCGLEPSLGAPSARFPGGFLPMGSGIRACPAANPAAGASGSVPASGGLRGWGGRKPPSGGASSSSLGPGPGLPVQQQPDSVDVEGGHGPCHPPGKPVPPTTGPGPCRVARGCGSRTPRPDAADASSGTSDRLPVSGPPDRAFPSSAACCAPAARPG